MAKTNVSTVQVPGEEPAIQQAEESTEQSSDSLESATNEIQSVADKPLVSRGSYRTMRAADIDHTKLTAPVMTLDGWLCPPAPEAKK